MEIITIEQRHIFEKQICHVIVGDVGQWPACYEKKILLLPADAKGPATVASYGRIRLFHLE